MGTIAVSVRLQRLSSVPALYCWNPPFAGSQGILHLMGRVCASNAFNEFRIYTNISVLHFIILMCVSDFVTGTLPGWVYIEICLYCLDRISTV